MHFCCIRDEGITKCQSYETNGGQFDVVVNIVKEADTHRSIRNADVISANGGGGGHGLG